MTTTKTLKRDPKNHGVYNGANGVKIERNVFEETNDYGRAGEVFWTVYDAKGNPIDTVTHLSVARDWFGIEAE